MHKLKKLAHNLQQFMSLQLTPKNINDINNGKTLLFGPLKINKKGIKHLFKTITWKEIDNIEISNGRVLIRKKDSLLCWSKPYTFQVKNLYIFLSLTQYFINNEKIYGVNISRFKNHQDCTNQKSAIAKSGKD